MSFVLLGILNSQAAGAGAAGAYDLLETTTLASSASSVSFTGLGSYSDYKHLQIRAVTQSDRGSSGVSDTLATFNSDTGANYAMHWLQGNGSSVSSTNSTSRNNIYLNQAPLTSANGFNAFVADILDFSSSSKNTTVRSFAGGKNSTERIFLISGLYNSTSAITSMTITDESNFVTGSRFSLYGVR